jgi:hypothetical protein
MNVGFLLKLQLLYNKKLYQSIHEMVIDMCEKEIIVPKTDFENWMLL